MSIVLVVGTMMARRRYKEVVMKGKVLKLFVWTEFCPGETEGLAFAVAESEEEAMELVRKAHGDEPYSWGVLEVHSLDHKLVRFVCEC